MDESHKYYIRIQYKFFLDPNTDHEKLIISTEEIDPASGFAIKIREIKDIEYRIYNNNIYEDLIEIDGPREVLFATIKYIDEKCLKLELPNLDKPEPNRNNFVTFPYGTIDNDPPQAYCRHTELS
jgi:hypothetical protein